MNLREQVSDLAKLMKEDSGLTWDELIDTSGLSRKQVSLILSGKGGVSFDKIEIFFKKVFETDLILSGRQDWLKSNH